MPSASCRWATFSRSADRSDSGGATPSSSTNEPRPATVSRWIRTPSHSSRWRSLSTTTSVPSAASSDARSVVRVRHRREPVAALARGGGVRAVVLDQHARRRAPPRAASAAPGGRGSTCRAGAARRGPRRRARGRRPASAPGPGRAPSARRCGGERTRPASLVHVVRCSRHGGSHRRRPRAAAPPGLDPARPQHAARRVPADARRRGDDPRVRGDARPAARRVRAADPAGERAGLAAGRRGGARGDPARRARARRRLPAARARRARRAPRHVPRRGGAAAGRLLREHPVRRGRRRGVRGRPDARHRRQRDPGDRPAQARRRAADHVRLPGRRARGRRGAAAAPTPSVPILTAALDRQLDGNGYIRPGLGDAGDRIFGTDR